VRNVEEPHKFLFRRFHLGRSISAVHLHESVGWGTGFMDDAGVLARARPAPDDPQIAIPAPEDALLITMAHAFYEDKAIKLSDLWRVVYLLRQGGLDWAALTAQVTQRGWREGLHTCIALWAALEVALYGEHSFPAAIAARAGQEAPAFSQEYLRQRLAEEVRFPFRVSFAFSKQHYYRKVWADQALSPAQKGLDALRHSLAGIRRRLPFRSQRPLLVTLSGMDGSGKTAVAEMLAAALQECEISARVVWSRGGSSALTDRVIALVKPLLPRERGSAPLDMTSDTRAAKVARKSHWLRRPLLRWGWRWLVVLDLLARYTAQVAWPLWRGRVVISDRYVVDALVELAALTGDKGEWRSLAARALMALCPRPRWALYLDVSPQAALQRKPEETLSYLKQQAPLYGQAARLGRLQRVDAAGDLATVADPLVEAVLRDYLDGYHTLVNALFLANPLPLEEG
jgi:thymidylate kinase